MKEGRAMFYVSHSNYRQMNINTTYSKNNKSEGLSLKVKLRFVMA